jgi:hypothetical protein
MIKSEIRSLIKNLVPKYEEVERFHDRVIDATCEQVIKEMLWELFAVDPLAIQRYTVEYGVSSAIPIIWDATKMIYYSNLPCAVIPMPDKASGVRKISTRTQLGFYFFPIDQREADLLFNTYVAEVNSKVGYSVNQTTVDYWGMDTTYTTLGVRMSILQPFSVYADTDTVLIPEFRDREGVNFTDRVLKLLGNIKPVELLENKQIEETNR